MSVQAIADQPNISLAQLLIHERWDSLLLWYSIDWLPVDHHLLTVKRLYGAHDTQQSLQLLEKAASVSWDVVETYPAQLFFHKSLHVVCSGPSQFLSAYLTHIPTMSTLGTRCSVSARPMTWDVPDVTPRSIVYVSSYATADVNADFVTPNRTRVVSGTESCEMFIMDI